MPSGGHASSGPPKDPNSIRSAGLKLRQLPSEGYRGDIPEFPLPDSTARERELWIQAWCTPQAVAWALESWRWNTIALYVRTFRICEGENATAADKNSLHRLADQIGMTPAGLQYNGWQITRDAVADKRDEIGIHAGGKNLDSAAARFKLIAGGSSA